MLRGIEIVKDAHGPFIDAVFLDYEDRHRRRIVLRGTSGIEFLLDLTAVPDMREGDGIVLSSGEIVHVRAADECLMEARCSDPVQLARIAWHVGNRHLPAEIGKGSIRLRADHVIANMIEGLGGRVRYLDAPFNPEGGAYDSRTLALADSEFHGHHHE
jgi:urease accessory protein